MTYHVGGDMPIMCSPELDLRIARGKAPKPNPFPMELLIPHEAQALKNHDQTLKRLKERGGLGAAELLAIMEDRPWKQMMEDDAFRALGEILDRATMAAINNSSMQRN